MTVHGTSVPYPKPAGDVRPTAATRLAGERVPLMRRRDGSYALPRVTHRTTDEGSRPAVVLDLDDGREHLVKTFDPYDSRQAWAMRDVVLERIHRAVGS